MDTLGGAERDLDVDECVLATGADGIEFQRDAGVTKLMDGTGRGILDGFKYLARRDLSPDQ